ncbi:MAG TPA: MFS transporter [Gammaproteobacteria bacterium]|nr:MFS transporter [Gammaproteobacteria bacterium]
MLKYPPFVQAKPLSEPSADSSFSWQPVGLLAGVLSIRMLGIFMVLPVLALYAGGLPGATPLLAGLAVGIYGVSQAVLQIPLGALSDRIGRKPVILLGLLIFAAGSALAAMADGIGLVIAGRALQGAGAISATVIALVADLTPEQRRTRAMAFVGISIGASFSLALIIGPLLASWLGVAGLFWLAAGLALCAISGLLAFIPTVPQSKPRAATPRFSWHQLIAPNVRALNGSIFLLHMLLTAVFVALPGVLLHQADLPAQHHWWLYLPALLISLGLMAPLIKRAEHSPRAQYQAMLWAIAFLTTGLLLMAIAAKLASPESLLWWLAVGLIAFFGGFNFLEAHLPASLSCRVAPEQRGMALGGYATCQFLGAFVGGVLGGFIAGWLAADSVFWFASVIGGIWFLFLLQPWPLGGSK